MGVFRQCFFIPTPEITEDSCPDQTDRVFIVTGGYAGVGFELSRILYAHNAIVYVAGRSEAKALLAIDAIKVATPNSAGRLEFLQVDLSNLKTVKPGVEGFISKERRLDVLINNAGVRYANANGKTMTIVADRCWKKVMYPPAGSKDAHGNDLQLGTNCVGPCLLYLLLEPLLTRTAAASPKGSVRVAWAGSVAVDMTSPKPDGMHLEDCGRPQDKGVTLNYGQTKVGNVFLSNFYAQNTPQTGIVHSSFNPGNLKTELTRHVNPVLRVASGPLLYPAIYGAYTELWAAVSPELTTEKSGAYVVPWGRIEGFRADVQNALKEPSAGGTGVASKFVAWCLEQVNPYV